MYSSPKNGVLDSRTNRAVLASLTFEPISEKEQQKQTTASSGGGVPSSGASVSSEPVGNQSLASSSAAAAAPPPQEKKSEPNDATKMVIRCMKLALSKSITGISMPEKFRPLNPQHDFDICTKLEFGGNGSRKGGSGLGCCSAASGNVKESPPMVPPPTQQQQSAFDDIETIGAGGVGGTGPDQGNENSGDIEQFTFTDYSPMCYRHLRSFFNIDATQYRDVLCHSGWHSIPTPGKSAAQLFFCGQNWVIKTMTVEESKFLRSILHRYYYHIRDNPHTLLPHFVGHHSIQFTKSSEKITFVIMQNVFATPNKIHEKFDLKGSTVGRFATKAEKMKQTCTKKDLDINKPLVLGEMRRKLLIEQMKRDCDFLRKASIMDYSFLVGIHHTSGANLLNATARASMKNADGTPAPGGPSTTASPDAGQQQQPRGGNGKHPADVVPDGRCFTSDQGGMLRLDDGIGSNPEIYYVGIIDILQEYNLWKFSETCVRSITNDSSQISSVHPREYAARFVEFMSSFIV